MLNQFDVGAQQDYDAMTEELGSEISVYLKKTKGIAPSELLKDHIFC